MWKYRKREVGAERVRRRRRRRSSSSSSSSEAPVGMFSWVKQEQGGRNKDGEMYQTVTEGLQTLYTKKLLPLEETYLFHDFHSPALEAADFQSKPMVLLVGQYSTGKTTFIRWVRCCRWWWWWWSRGEICPRWPPRTWSPQQTRWPLFQRCCCRDCAVCCQAQLTSK